ncbi:MAG TPA: DNA topoisomerase IB [Solirubrobacteraceae bacterium]|jgi:DNA topoisomerase IB
MSTTAAGKRRLRRSDCAAPGWGRVRRGRGFSYVNAHGDPIDDPQKLERVRALAIPPAWKEVWICPDLMGHLQATGIDAAGRKQYLYHEKWREHRDRAKFEKMLSFGRGLPRLRRRLAADLDGAEPTRDRVLACAVRLLDVGVFRIGSEQYADDDGGLGLATLHREHVTVHEDSVEFDFPAKGGQRRRQVISDPASFDVVAALRRRRAGGEQLLAYRERRRWHDIRSDDINDYVKLRLGDEFSAKDFRTWNGTVMAAVSLATHGLDANSKSARKRAINRAVSDVAQLLGNTPAVARRSYIDPRVFDRYRSGWTIAGVLARIPDPGGIDDRVRARVERGVIDLLEDDHDSAALERI